MSRGSLCHNYDYISVCSSRPRHRLSLIFRQQPIQARFSTSNERDRKPIEPPPIIQIQLKDGSSQEMQDFLQNPYFFMCVNLTSPTSKEDVNRPDNRVLSGQTVSSMYKLKDVTDKDGGFFCFGDLSSRLEGEYRLKFTLFEIIANGAINLMHTFSNVFKVYNSKSMPKLLDATFLSRSFADQGVRIRIRKEHRVQATSTRKRKLSSEDDLAKSPSQQHSRHTPAPFRSTKCLPLTAPTSPSFNSYYTAYDQLEQQEQHLHTGRSGHQLEVCAHPPFRRDHSNYNREYQSKQQLSNDYMHSIPFSPPTQPYDIYSRQTSMSHHPQKIQQYHHCQQQQTNRQDQIHPYYQQYPSPTTMLSPPSTQLKLEHRHQSTDDGKMTFPLSPRVSILSTTSTMNTQPSIPLPPPHYQHRSSESSIDSTSTTIDYGYHLDSICAHQLSDIQSSPNANAIRLPPLHTMIPCNGDRNEGETINGTAKVTGKSDVGDVNAAVAMMQLSRRQTITTSPDQYTTKNIEVTRSLFQQSQQNQHHYHHHYCQHDHQQFEPLDPSRRASIGILNSNLY
ncbi:unnamed protein product [Absidia cylindrospora]